MSFTILKHILNNVKKNDEKLEKIRKTQKNRTDIIVDILNKN